MRKKRPVIARFMDKVIIDTDTGCWLWTACKFPSGYACFDCRRAHRVSYELFKGFIPDGLELDHLCRVRHCVNPEHLEPVTRLENARRSQLSTYHRGRCARGHIYNSKTLYLYGGRRHCRICRTATMNALRAKNRLR